MTRVQIPDGTDEEVTRGKKRALESEEEPVKKKKKSGTVTKRSDLSPTESSPSRESKSATKERLTTDSSTKPPSTKEPTKVEVKPGRAAAVDFFDSDSPSPPKSPASKMTISRKSIESKPSPDGPAPKKPQGEKPSETKSILKSSRKGAKSSTVDVPVKEKHVKFVAKLSNLKTRRDKALGLTGKKVRSGGGKGASVKDGVLGKNKNVNVKL